MNLLWMKCSPSEAGRRHQQQQPRSPHAINITHFYGPIKSTIIIRNPHLMPTSIIYRCPDYIYRLPLFNFHITNGWLLQGTVLGQGEKRHDLPRAGGEEGEDPFILPGWPRISLQSHQVITHSNSSSGPSSYEEETLRGTLLRCQLKAAALGQECGVINSIPLDQRILGRANDCQDVHAMRGWCYVMKGVQDGPANHLPIYQEIDKSLILFGWININNSIPQLFALNQSCHGISWRCG